uniref:Internal scaffolding protein n=1 Tax=Dulem virus 166 TaxID=3145643 RepID=A0AAU8AVN7_9VIRU
MFNTNWANRPPKTATHSGNRFEPTYKMAVDEDGVKDLAVTGQTDIYAYIQSYAQSCDINYILDRFARGDESALSKIQGIYGDFTEVPKSLAELSQRVLDAENIFNQLPLETREQFNFSPTEFFTQFGSDKFNEIMGFTPEPDAGTGVKPLEPIEPIEPIKSEGGVANE